LKGESAAYIRTEKERPGGLVTSNDRNIDPTLQPNIQNSVATNSAKKVDYDQFVHYFKVS
jgi:hypothetical protein